MTSSEAQGYTRFSCILMKEPLPYFHTKMNLTSGVRLTNKYCDLIIANDVSKKDTGFNVDYNAVSIIDKNGIIKNLPKNKKSFIAQKIAKRIVNEFLIDDKNIN